MECVKSFDLGEINSSAKKRACKWDDFASGSEIEKQGLITKSILIKYTVCFYATVLQYTNISPTWPKYHSKNGNWLDFFFSNCFAKK